MINDDNIHLEKRPADIRVGDWKNRFLVSSKLTPSNHKKFRNWCRANKFSYSSGINYLISNYIQENDV